MPETTAGTPEPKTETAPPPVLPPQVAIEKKEEDINKPEGEGDSIEFKLPTPEEMFDLLANSIVEIWAGKKKLDLYELVVASCLQSAERAATVLKTKEDVAAAKEMYGAILRQADSLARTACANQETFAQSTKAELFKEGKPLAALQKVVVMLETIKELRYRERYGKP